jgi:hypothetical protein
VDHGGEALTGFVAAHGNAFELFDLADEVLDQMAPFIDFRIDVERAFTPWTLGNDDFRSTFVHVRDNPIRIKSFAGDAGAQEPWRNASARRSPSSISGVNARATRKS